MIWLNLSPQYSKLQKKKRQKKKENKVEIPQSAFINVLKTSDN